MHCFLHHSVQTATAVILMFTRLFHCSFLAMGNSYQTLSAHFRMGVSTVHSIVKDCCDVIWTMLQTTEMPEPTIQDWEEISKGFSHRWNFPLCLGALDGKHTDMNAPKNQEAYTFSLVVMALVDHDHRFVFVDIEDYSRNSNGGVWKHSAFGKAHENVQLNTPPPKFLPNYAQVGPMHHCTVADKAFPLRPDLMKPYTRGRGKLPHGQAIFNCRLPRA